MKPTPNYQSIDKLPLISGMIDDMSEDAEEFYVTLSGARSKPHILDDAIINKVIQQYRERTKYDVIFVEQLARWSKDKLTDSQRQEVECLIPKMRKLADTHKNVLQLAVELSADTIEKVLGKSDFDLGVEFLTGKVEL